MFCIFNTTLYLFQSFQNVSWTIQPDYGLPLFFWKYTSPPLQLRLTFSTTCTEIKNQNPSTVIDCIPAFGVSQLHQNSRERCKKRGRAHFFHTICRQPQRDNGHLCNHFSRPTTNTGSRRFNPYASDHHRTKTVAIAWKQFPVDILFPCTFIFDIPFFHFAHCADPFPKPRLHPPPALPTSRDLPPPAFTLGFYLWWIALELPVAFEGPMEQLLRGWKDRERKRGAREKLREEGRQRGRRDSELARRYFCAYNEIECRARMHSRRSQGHGDSFLSFPRGSGFGKSGQTCAHAVAALSMFADVLWNMIMRRAWPPCYDIDAIREQHCRARCRGNATFCDVSWYWEGGGQVLSQSCVLSALLHFITLGLVGEFVTKFKENWRSLCLYRISILLKNRSIVYKTHYLLNNFTISLWKNKFSRQLRN